MFRKTGFIRISTTIHNHSDVTQLYPIFLFSRPTLFSRSCF